MDLAVCKVAKQQKEWDCVRAESKLLTDICIRAPVLFNSYFCHTHSNPFPRN